MKLPLAFGYWQFPVRLNFENKEKKKKQTKDDKKKETTSYFVYKLRIEFFNSFFKCILLYIFQMKISILYSNIVSFAAEKN